jgi:hypothetical protein
MSIQGGGITDRIKNLGLGGTKYFVPKVLGFNLRSFWG